MMGVGPDLAAIPGLIMARGGELGQPVHLLVETTSTNDEAKSGARRGAPHGSLWVAEAQTRGRGRQGRAWLSPPGESLLFSVLARLDVPPAKLPRVALLAGLAVRDAVARVAPAVPARIKWPNDVLLGDRKVAGVLVEAVTAGARVEAIVIGIGLNVHTRTFPAEIAERATSVALGGAGQLPDRGAILADIVAGLDRELRHVHARGLGLVRARLEAADALVGRPVRADDGDQGVACGIDDDGRLLVRRRDGVVARWVAGEVHMLSGA